MVFKNVFIVNGKQIEVSFLKYSGYVRTVKSLTLALLALPEEQIREEVDDFGAEESSLLERIALRLAAGLMPGGVEQWAALLSILPDLFEIDYYPPDGETNARQALENAFEQDILSILEQWDHPKAKAARQPLPQRIPPDPTAGWTPQQWYEAYQALPDYGEKAKLRHRAEALQIDTSNWPVEEELRERYRAYRRADDWGSVEGIVLRTEAAQRGISTKGWENLS